MTRTALFAGTALASLATAMVVATMGASLAPHPTQVVELPRVVITGQVTPIVELPRVVVTGRVMSPEAVAARQQVIELPRVVVTGTVVGGTTAVAQGDRIAAGAI